MGRIIRHEFRIPGKDVDAEFSRRGIRLPNELRNGGYDVAYLGEDGDKHALYVKYVPSGGQDLGVNAARTIITAQDKRPGRLIHNVQSYSRLRDMDGAPLLESHKFLDSKAGMHLGLDILREESPDVRMHIIAPHEIRRLWGKRSEFHLASPSFFKHIRRLPKKDTDTLIKRILFEYPEYAPALEEKELVPPEILARLSSEVEDARKSGKSVPGRNRLRRELAEFSQKAEQKPLGKRMSRAYYSIVPKQHDFHENDQPIGFGEHGTIHVLTREAGKRTRVWGPFLTSHREE